QLLPVHVRDSEPFGRARDLEAGVRRLVRGGRVLPARRASVLHRPLPADQDARGARRVHQGPRRRVVRDAPRGGRGVACGAGARRDVGRDSCRGAGGLMPKVLVTDYAWPSLEIERGILGELGAELVVAETGEPDELVELADGVDAILTNWKRVP